MTGVILAVLSLALLGIHGLSCLLVGRRLRSVVPQRVTETPFISLLRPVCGLDRFDPQTLATSFRLDYPDYEVIFCVACGNDPVVPVVRRLIADHPEVDARLLIGETRISANPKLNNLEKGWKAARGEIVVMADANLLLPHDYLWHLLSARQPGVGLVSAPPVGVAPEGPWAALECAFLNSNQARWQLAADICGFGFAQGKTLLWERAILDREGGLAALGRYLAEDVAATHLVRGGGRRVALAARPFAQPIGRRSLSQVWARQLRWSKVRRDGFPLLFLVELLNGPLLAVILATVAAGWPFGLALLVVWYCAELALAADQGWIDGPGSAAFFLLRDLMFPVIWLVTFRNRHFEWRGNLMAQGELRRLIED